MADDDDFTVYSGGPRLTEEEWKLVNTQRAISEWINNNVVQVPALELGRRSKAPTDQGWTTKEYRAFNFQKWVDDESLRHANAGFKMCNGWVDIDMDSKSNEYVMTVHRALRFLNIDNRLQFGRIKRGVPTHVFLKISEEEASIYSDLQRYVPHKFKWHDENHHVEIRSSTLTKTRTDWRQTAIPGSVYDKNDIIAWYVNYQVQTNVEHLMTSPHTHRFEDIVRAIAFASIAHMLRDLWVEGSRHPVCLRTSGWLVGVVTEATAVVNNRFKVPLINLPVYSYDTARSLLEFLLQEFGDDEPHLRRAALEGSIDKADRDPNMKLPGWRSMKLLFDEDDKKLGDQFANAARISLFPNAEVSQLSYLVDRYIYDRTSGCYIDFDHFKAGESYQLDPTNVMRAERHLKVLLNGKSYSAFDMFEESTLRRQVTVSRMFPNYAPGEILRVHGERIVPDEYEGSTSLIFNSWGGFLHEPVEEIDPKVMAKCLFFLDQMLQYLTRGNPAQIEWVKQWVAQLIQQPGTKLQMAWAAVGGQGVGKSFFGNVFMRALLGPRLCGTADSKIFRNQFSVTPFIDKLFVLVDEANLTSESADAVKNIIRNTDINGEQKHMSAANYKIYARVMFSSNRLDLNVGDREMRDRALFYTHAIDAKSMNMTEFEFKKYAESLSPFFEEFAIFLRDVNNVRHFIRYFMDYKWDAKSILSLEHSSGNDEDLLRASMPMVKRIVMAYVEQGGKTGNPKGWDQPLDLKMDKDSLDLLRSTLSQYNIPIGRIADEMVSIGLYTKAGGMYKPIYRWGDAIKVVEGSYGVVLNTLRAPNDDEHGKVGEVFMPPARF